MRLCVIIKAGKIESASLVEDEHLYGVHNDHFHFYCPFTNEPDCREKENEYGQGYSRDNDESFNSGRG